ncbi:MAG: RNA polymerase sigma factor [Planctomycetota bacterium]|jgi:RNA polymerase sigma factor (sigma-70 family)
MSTTSRRASAAKPRVSLPETTNTFLLEALADGANRTIWTLYVNKWRPLIVNFARKLGLSADLAEEVAQLSLVSFTQAYWSGKYSRSGGRLRDWLFGIAYRRICKVCSQCARERDRMRKLLDNASLDDCITEGELEKIWNREWATILIRQGLKEIRSRFRPKTIRSFELLVLKEWSPDRVAAHLGITRSAVFVHKHRVLKKLRKQMTLLDSGLPGPGTSAAA